MQAHRPTIVKVNAEVDEGIAPLVAALSEFPALRTLNSCEGAAFVDFRVNGTLEEQAVFLCWLSRQIIGLGNLTAEWGGRDSLLYSLRCSPAAITSLASRIAQVSIALRSSICDKARKESGNSQALPDHLASPGYSDQPGIPFDLMLCAVRS